MGKAPELVWHKISVPGKHGLDFLHERQIKSVEVNTELICLIRLNNQIFATKSRCPHSGGPLVEGTISPEGDIVCPWHRFAFCVKDGKNTSGEGYYLENFPVEIREDGIYVGMERRKFLGLF